MTGYYLDTSIAAHALLRGGRAARWLDETTSNPTYAVFSSRLLQTELTRTLRREDRAISERDDVLDYVGIVPITEGVLATAEAITEHVKTLDAIHLATALSLGSGVIVVSHDQNQLRVAEQIGLHTLDPLEEPARG